VLEDKIKNIAKSIEFEHPVGSQILNNLKVIFFDHSQFVEGGTMGSTIQPIH
jgi:hypothetical protein